MLMPTIFVGHGSPMNAIENNSFTQQWKEIGEKIQPKAILMISGHWFTHGLLIQDEENPIVINDMYPKRNIPVVQLSIDLSLSKEELFNIGQDLIKLREDGILIIGSGNEVHNLREVDFNHPDGFEWAKNFNQSIKEAIVNQQFDKVIEYKNFGKSAQLSVPTTDHFDPLVYILGTFHKQDHITVFNDAYMAGSLSMTSYMFSH